MNPSDARRRWPARALLFDMDGVLVDSMPLLVRLLDRWADLHALDRELVQRTAHGRREAELVAELAPWTDVAEQVALLQEWQVSEFDGCRACPGAPELLDALGDLPWAVVTSGSRAVATGRLREAGLPLPAVLVTSDDVRHGKPHPEPYLRGAQLLGVAAGDCVVVEDAPSGAASGHGAGMRVLAVAPPSASWPESLSGRTLRVASLHQVGVSRPDAAEGGVTLLLAAPEVAAPSC